MGTLSRPGAGVRNPSLPPSSFRRGPLAEDRDKTLRRASRVDVDFEQALLSQDTITLREGRDVNSLGNEHDPAAASTMEDRRLDPDVSSSMPPASTASPLSPASSRRPKRSQPTHPSAPHTPAAKSTNTNTTLPIPISNTINVLAEPPADGPSSFSTPIPRPPKQNQPGEDAEDFELKRRSLFRSPGTASSPDLATLVRKQRERNAHVPSLPTTTQAPDAWGTVSARQRTVSRETGKPPKSMRAKTTSFFTKVFGGNGSMREKGVEPSTSSRAGFPYYNHSNYSAFTETPSSPSPPVPALPEAYRSPPQPALSPKLPPQPAEEMKKLFLPITVAPTSSDSEGDVFVDATDGSSSMVLVSNPPSPAETRTPQSQFRLTPQQSPLPSPSTSIQGTSQPQAKQPLAPSAQRSLNRSREGKRRRSMSVGDAEQWHKILGNGSPLPSSSKPPHQKEVSGSATAAVKEWENALSGFDAHIASLEIKDPGSFASGSGASGSGVKAAGKVRRKEEKSLAPNKKAPNRQRKGSKPDLLPLSLPMTGAGGAPSLTLSPVLTNSPSSGALLSPALSISSTASAPVSGGGSGTVRRGSRTGSSNRGANVNAGLGMGGVTAQSPRVATLRGSGSGSTSGSGSGGGANLERRPSGLALPPSGSTATVRGRDHREPTVSLTSPSRDSLLSGKAKVQPRTAASSSEPALVPGTNYADEGVRTVRLIPGRHSTSSSNRDRDITTDDLVSTKFPTRGSHSVDEPESLEVRAARIAQRIWAEDETFKARERYSEWMGQPEQLNAVVLRKYMDKFEFGGLRVDMAFRRLCAKLYLRGETQVIDRILIEFSRRYFEHNLNCPLGSASNAHQVVYSILLLNTDLHIAELSSHMTKQQFLNNTMVTLERPAHLPSSNSSSNPAMSSSSNRPSTSSTPVRSSSPAPMTDDLERGHPFPDPHATIKSKRSGSMHSWKAASGSAVHLIAPISSSSVNASSASITEAGFNATPLSSLGRKHGSGQGSISNVQFTKGWEAEVESYLKEIYTDVKKQQILQPISSTGMLSPSGASLGRGLSQRRSGNDRIANLKRGSIRGLQGLINAQGAANGSSSSIDGRISPSLSDATSFNDGTTASSSTLFTSPGFASNLTHTIIKETHENDSKSIASDDSNSTSVSISDEELALFGAPWAKEGILCKRQAWETIGKKSKNNKWMDVFVVIQKGQLSMFVFGESSSGGSRGGVVGGGNWAKNANQVGEFMLSHSLSHILPPPGISKRPNCFVLSLADGAVYFFQAGTEELANEWVSTCNYWAARQSKEPLPGGVSNIEYGWNRVEDDAHAQDDEGDISEAEKALAQERENRAKSDYSADTFSLRSQRSRLGVRLGDGFATLRGGSNPYTDRIYINEWKAPMPNMHISTLDEEGQLESLQRQTETLKEELKKHDALKAPMTALYPAKSTSLAKAVDNWNKRSSYLLTETVKYELYIDSLKAAMKERLRRRGEKALEKALDQVNPSVGKWGFKEEDTIEETEEPTTPGPMQGMFKHRREGARAADR